ncbi:MAG: AAA family ATPase [bacterium]
MTDDAARFQDGFGRLRDAMRRSVVGCDEAVEHLLVGFFAGGHVLIESEPGLGKTLLAKSFAAAAGLPSARIQFTPDLMPADITGTNIFVEEPGGARRFEFRPGPVFTQILLADEITRATPKTQSALLEAMQERRVTAAGETRPLDSPFFVIATQPPEGSQGTYPLPEAQLDRFLLKLVLAFPEDAALREIGRRSVEESDAPQHVVEPAEVDAMLAAVRRVRLVAEATDRAAELVLATHPGRAGSIDLANRYVRYGASPRGAQALVTTGKVRALLAGRAELGPEDVEAAVLPCLRHRVILNFEAGVEGVRPEQIIDQIVERGQ